MYLQFHYKRQSVYGERVFMQSTHVRGPASNCRVCVWDYFCFPMRTPARFCGLYLYRCVCQFVCVVYVYSNSNPLLVWLREPPSGAVINDYSCWIYLKKGQLGHIIHIFCKWKSTFHPSDITLGFTSVAEWFLSVCSSALETVCSQICLSAASKSQEKSRQIHL